MDYARLKPVTQFLRSHCGLKKQLFLTMLLLAGVCNVSIAIPIQTEVTQQTRKVSGTVISKEDNMPVTGATVLVEGTSIGAITDINGEIHSEQCACRCKEAQNFFCRISDTDSAYPV